VVSKLAPDRVLEIGPGPGVFKSAAAAIGIEVETVDVDRDLNPDIVASVLRLPFKDDSYDVVCAFQVLEHLRYDHALKALSEIIRVSKKDIIISLPNAQKLYYISAHIPFLGVRYIHLKSPFSKPKDHEFDGQHYWEINKKGYSLKKIISDLSKLAKIKHHFRSNLFSYHHFIILEKAKTK
jgi:ubiquinone/menaquinone biosynthesis C-methylase UbiE